MGYSAPRDFRAIYGLRVYNHEARSDYWTELPDTSAKEEARWKSYTPEYRWKMASWALADCLRYPSTTPGTCDSWRKYLVDCPRGQLDSPDAIPYWLAPRENGFAPLDVFLDDMSAEEKCNFGKERFDECIEQFGKIKYCDLWWDMLKHCKAAKDRRC